MFSTKEPRSHPDVPLLSVHRHALPLFTSLLNVVCAYDPVGYGIPYNHLLFSDYREQLVEQAVQILIVALEHDGGVPHRPSSPSSMEEQEVRTLRSTSGPCWKVMQKIERGKQ